MDQQGVTVHALSLTAPMVYWAGADLAVRLSQAFNDACAAALDEPGPEAWDRTCQGPAGSCGQGFP